MKITLDWLREKSACEEGVSWFVSNFGNEADCQNVLDELGKLNKINWATWLIGKAGANSTVLEIQGDIEIEHSLFCLGTIKVSGKVVCKSIITGGDIEVGGGVYAIAKTKTEPKNLLLGTFVPVGGGY